MFFLLLTQQETIACAHIIRYTHDSLSGFPTITAGSGPQCIKKKRNKGYGRVKVRLSQHNCVDIGADSAR
jgi:hypothetical protein